jgi:predicted lysophospholipase L1 biosynthesis ABC-type transport system permease subunit
MKKFNRAVNEYILTQTITALSLYLFGLAMIILLVGSLVNQWQKES